MYNLREREGGVGAQTEDHTEKEKTASCVSVASTASYAVSTKCKRERQIYLLSTA